MLLGLCLATHVALAQTPTHAKSKATPAKSKATAGKPEKSAHHPAPKRDRYPSVALFAAHVNETLAYRPHDDKGRARRDASRELQRLLRCRQTGQQHPVAPLLAEALYQIGRHYEGHRLEIYSGYRPRAYCTRTHSRHMNGSAIDFHVDGISNEALIAYLRKTFHPAGVGYYPHGVHVHLDLDRKEDTYWIDAGTPAPAPLLSDTPDSSAPAYEEPQQEAEPEGLVPREHLGVGLGSVEDNTPIEEDRIGYRDAIPVERQPVPVEQPEPITEPAEEVAAGPQALPTPPTTE